MTATSNERYCASASNQPVAHAAALQSDRWVGGFAAHATHRAAVTLAALAHGVVVEPLGRTWQDQSSDTTLRTYTTPLTKYREWE